MSIKSKTQEDASLSSKRVEEKEKPSPSGAGGERQSGMGNLRQGK